MGTALDPQGYAQYGAAGGKVEGPHRFGSFAPTREHNDVKWYVDGCSYFYAVSRALENARESIWILDCEFCSMGIRQCFFFPLFIIIIILD